MPKLTSIWGSGKLEQARQNFDILESQFITRGTHTVTAGEASANSATIQTGDLEFTAFMVQIYRAGVLVNNDAVVTAPGAGNLVVSDGSVTYNMTAGDVINWLVF